MKTCSGFPLVYTKTLGAIAQAILKLFDDTLTKTILSELDYQHKS